MNPIWINVATLFAFAAIALELTLQIRRVWNRKHSADISLPGELTRLCAISVMQIKFRFVGDPILIYGQLLTLVLLSIYVVLIFTYRNAV